MGTLEVDSWFHRPCLAPIHPPAAPKLLNPQQARLLFPVAELPGPQKVNLSAIVGLSMPQKIKQTRPQLLSFGRNLYMHETTQLRLILRRSSTQACLRAIGSLNLTVVEAA